MGHRLALAMALFAVACSSGADETNPELGGLVGRVELTSGVPATVGRVTILGTPFGTLLSDTGSFSIPGVPAGAWRLRVTGSDGGEMMAPKDVDVAINPSIIENTGVITLSAPGFVTGELLSVMMPTAGIVGIPDSGAVTTPEAAGTYFLSGVVPGTREIIAIHGGRSLVREGIEVLENEVTRNIDFNFELAEDLPATVVGSARFRDGGSAGIEVFLLRAQDGREVDRVTVGSDGSFTFVAPPDAYVVRARAGESENQISIPSGALAAGRTFRVTLILSSGDADGDGLPDESDPDIDNDGCANSDDAFPYDPLECEDTDGDGIGDRSDPDNETDTDGDSVIDSADNCVSTPNTDQLDTDDDTVGELCDNCPLIAQSDQTDFDGDGIGDLCDNCPTVHNPEQGAGDCVACTMHSECMAPTPLCDPVLKVCVECIGNADCQDGLFCNGQEACNGAKACVAGTPPTIDDGIACTDDACNESTDQVTHTADDAKCADSSVCSQDVCNVNLGCVSTATVLIYDGTPGGSPVLADAAQAQGFTVVVTTNEGAFTTAFDAGGFDALLIDEGMSTLPLGVETRVATWTSQSKPIAIFAPVTLDAGLIGDFGYSTSAPSGMDQTILIDGEMFPNMASFVVIDNPAPQAMAFSGVMKNGAGHWDSGGETTIVWTRHNRSAINGFITSQLDAQDNNANMVVDRQDLVQEELQAVCMPPPSLFGFSDKGEVYELDTANFDELDVWAWTLDVVGAAVSPKTGQVVYATNEPSTVLRELDLVEQSSKEIGPVSVPLRALVFAEDGTLYGLVNETVLPANTLRIVEIDPTTGAIDGTSDIDALGPLDHLAAAFRPGDPRLYVWTRETETVYRMFSVDIATATASDESLIDVPHLDNAYPDAAVWDPTRRMFIVADVDGFYALERDGLGNWTGNGKENALPTGDEDLIRGMLFVCGNHVCVP